MAENTGGRGPADADPADLVIRHAHVMPLDAAGTTFDDGWIAIAGGSVVGLGAEPPPEPAAARTIDAGGRLVMPGMISGHTHSMDRSARGLDPGPTFPDWLMGVYYRSVLGHGPEDAARAATLTARELLAAGVTTVVDCWGVGDPGTGRARECAEATIAAYRAAGIRVVLAVMVGDVAPLTMGHDALRMVGPTNAVLDQLSQLMARRHDPDGGVEIWPAPELPEMASDDLWLGCAELAHRHGARITTHLHASEPGAWADADHTVRATERLAHLGVLDDLVGAHASHLDDGDVARLAHHAAGVVHCPSAAMALAGSATPLAHLHGAGVPVGLGLDNPSLTATADALAELRVAVGWARASTGDQTWPTPEHGLAMATVLGARAIGRADRVGSIVVGGDADLLVVDTTGPHWWPPMRPERAFALCARTEDIRTVIVAGRVVVDERELLALGEPTG
ncbi:MAG: amidohydrolase family protein [Actinomycetota bacterium]|nr:amidohydrolase family protein [Actinomycetota bacterium]